MQQCAAEHCHALTDQTNYCPQHLESVLHVKIQPSTIPAAGLGLFTTIDRPRNRRIVPYLGELITDNGDEMIGGDYHLEYAPGKLVDASSPTCSAGRFTNDKRSSRGNNCKFILDQKTGIVWIVSKRRISAGAELFVSYGEHDYWTNKIM
jgi:hypothetical protein